MREYTSVGLRIGSFQRKGAETQRRKARLFFASLPPCVSALASFLFLLLPAVASAQTNWDDPTLADAVQDVDLIVLARASAVANNGAAYVVEKTIKGPNRDGERQHR